jgi:hypothetical protein
MGEAFLVGLIVAWATVTTAWHLAPAGWRRARASRLRARADCGAGALMSAAARIAARPAGTCADCGARQRCPLTRGKVP